MIQNSFNLLIFQLLLIPASFSQQISNSGDENDTTAIVVVVVFDVNTNGKISNISVEKINNCFSCTRKTKKHLAKKAVKVIKNIKSIKPGEKRMRLKQPLRFEIIDLNG